MQQHSIGNLTELVKLDLGNNSLQGTIPSSLGKLQYLTSLSLFGNNFSGSIPGEVFSLRTLSITLDLSGNNLVGSLPTEVVHLKNLVKLDVSGNMLHGHLPDNLGACVGLEFLYMEGNNFQGPIPSTVSSLKSLTELDLSRNNLSGVIPRFLEGLNILRYVNLSYNNFEGEVPSGGIFNNTSAAFVNGNGKLCGGSAQLHLPGCPSPEGKSKLTLKLAISITCALFVAFVVALFLFFSKFKRKTRHLSLRCSDDCALFGAFVVALFRFFSKFKRKTRDHSLRCSDDPPLLVISYHNLAKATDGFSEANLLGVGAFGSVYKGTIGEGEDRTIIAVKVLNLFKRGAEKSFLAECKDLRNIRHRNLVKVLTACSGIDSERNDFKALIYEYMPNGSLENWLHPNLEGGVGAHGTRRHLSLVQRMNIAIDVGFAIEYLHHQCGSPIVHCDLKPSNILLDAEMIAHVGDFGLARFIPQANHPPYTIQSSSVGIRGSTGYMAPEYGMGSEVSTSGDAYSYGILLLELFAGKRPTDEMFNEGLNLHNFAKKALAGQVDEVADRSLLEGRHTDLSMKCDNHEDKRRNRVEECLLSVYHVGVACSNENPKERITIADAVAELNSIRSRLVV